MSTVLSREPTWPAVRTCCRWGWRPGPGLSTVLEAGTPITYADVELDEPSTITCLRRQQDALVFRKECRRRSPRRKPVANQDIDREKHMDITRVGVVGGGLMGSGIAEVCARAGTRVVVVEADEARSEAAYQRILRSTNKALKRGKITADEQQNTLARVTVSHDLESLAQCRLVIEAVSELVDLKLDIFGRLDRLVEDREAILASNTSSIPIARLGAATTRPEKVVGIHFFNPAPVMKLVEVIPAITTSEETLKIINDFVSIQLGKSVVLCRDQAGFVVNGLVVPLSDVGVCGCSKREWPPAKTSTRPSNWV